MSEDQDEASKTEDPTAKRLADAREKGQVPKSQEFNHLFMFGMALMLILLVLPWSFGRMTQGLVPFLERPHSFPTDAGNMGLLLEDVLFDTLFGLSVPLFLLFIAGILASVVQVGWLTSTENFLKFKLNRIDPLTNLKQKVSLKNLVEFLKSLLKLVVVGVVIFVLLVPIWDGVEHFISVPIQTLVMETKALAAKIIFAVVLVLLVLALADYGYQRFEFMKQMRMSKQEIKDEFKQTEGDPLIKGKIRQLRMERSRNRMMAAVPEADVVVTNPT
ncbi:MAG: flagellar biosynthesis protein FlhB, partial [Pseudomonadota bacterium]